MAHFQKHPNPVFENDAPNEDTDAVFFDADMDGDLDLYVASGSYEYPENDPRLKDRLYLNNGIGIFAEAEKNLPDLTTNSTIAKPADVDADGDLDIFIGGGYINRKYPSANKNHLLINNGKGVFEKKELEIREAGNVTDAIWTDLNGDQFPELIVVGEWMPVRVFGNEKGRLSDQTNQYFKEPLNGLWNSIHVADFDDDGDQDLLVGNLGTNSQLSAIPDEPLELFYSDFDENG